MNRQKLYVSIGVLRICIVFGSVALERLKEVQDGSHKHKVGLHRKLQANSITTKLS